MRFYNSINNNELYDLEEIRMMANHDSNFTNEMINVFLNTSKEFLNKMDALFLTEDIETIGRLSHKIIPSVRSLKIYSILVELNFIESEAKTTDPDINLIKNAYQKVKYTLLNVCEKLESDIVP